MHTLQNSKDHNKVNSSAECDFSSLIDASQSNKLFGVKLDEQKIVVKSSKPPHKTKDFTISSHESLKVWINSLKPPATNLS